MQEPEENTRPCGGTLFTKEGRGNSQGWLKDVGDAHPGVPPSEPSEPKEPNEEKKEFPMTNFLLIWTFVVINAFIGICLFAFIITGSEPTTLIIATFSFFGFECGAMGAIKISSHQKQNKDKEDNNNG